MANEMIEFEEMPRRHLATIVLEEREDGGIAAYSPDFPGLILSGRDGEKVVADLLPALLALRTYKGE